MLKRVALLSLLLVAAVAATAVGAASHSEWPTITGKDDRAPDSRGVTLVGTARSDKLLGNHGSDTLRGKGGSDVLWGDRLPSGQPTGQRDAIWGGDGNDFIYASHGHNSIHAGAGNDAISAHYGRGLIDCGPGRDIYHVPKSLKGKYKIRNCEKVDRRSEKQRGGGLVPLR